MQSLPQIAKNIVKIIKSSDLLPSEDSHNIYLEKIMNIIKSDNIIRYILESIDPSYHFNIALRVFSLLKLEKDVSEMMEKQMFTFTTYSLGSYGTEQCEECWGRGQITCDECGGNGSYECSECEGYGEVDCRDCNGEGSLECSQCDGDGEDEEGDTCTSCGGQGTEECSDCDGAKKVECKTCNGDAEFQCEECNGDGENECVMCDGDGNVVDESIIEVKVNTYISFDKKLKSYLLDKIKNDGSFFELSRWTNGGDDEIYDSITKHKTFEIYEEETELRLSYSGERDEDTMYFGEINLSPEIDTTVRGSHFWDSELGDVNKNF
jgi:hypothetical protein